MFEASSLLRKVLSYCDGMPTDCGDEATWYRGTLRRLDVPRENWTFGPRNPIREESSVYKHRLRRLCGRWRHNASVDQADAWTRSPVGCYNPKHLAALSGHPQHRHAQFHGTGCIGHRPGPPGGRDAGRRYSQVWRERDICISMGKGPGTAAWR